MPVWMGRDGGPGYEGGLGGWYMEFMRFMKTGPGGWKGANVYWTYKRREGWDELGESGHVRVGYDNKYEQKIYTVLPSSLREQGGNMVE